MYALVVETYPGNGRPNHLWICRVGSLAHQYQTVDLGSTEWGRFFTREQAEHEREWFFAHQHIGDDGRTWWPPKD